VLALVNATLQPSCAAALEAERGWELRRVPSVRSAVGALPAELRDEVDALVVEAEPVTAELLAQLPSLSVVACLRSDPVNVDVAAATARGVPVLHTPGRNAEAVADFTLGLCLSMLRNIAVSHHGIVSGELSAPDGRASTDRAAGDVIWRPADPAAPVPYVVYKGRQLSSIVLGLIGYGAVGIAVARRFAGLVREILVADPACRAAEVDAPGRRLVALDELLAAADVVSIHARSSACIVGAAELKAMRPGSYLVNTARATVLDYEALADALESGHLRAAALDVFPEEPLPASSRLIGLRGLTLTPHLAGATEEVGGRQSEIFLEAMRALYASPPAWTGIPVRNPEVRERWLAARDRSDPARRAAGGGTRRGASTAEVAR
jgi:D-3-phosphoglycerate dehydrogenase